MVSGRRIYFWILIFFSSVTAVAQTPKDRVKCAADDGNSSEIKGPKAINGSPTSRAAWPWFAALILQDKIKNETLAFCGGTVITPQWVLTAAHCLENIDKATKSSDGRKLQVIIGIDDLRSLAPSNSFDVETFAIHESYEAGHKIWLKELAAAKTANQPEPPGPALRVGSDIALIKLARTWTGALAPLPAKEEAPRDAYVRVAGFGTVELYKDFNNDIQPKLRTYILPQNRKLIAGCARLMQVTLPSVTSKKCLKRYQAEDFVPAIGASQLCAGFETENQDSCNGDSGGPMVAVSASGAMRQFGVVSWGAANCAGVRRSYGIYTRVATYRDWIEKHTGPLQELTQEAAAASSTSNFFRAALGDLSVDVPNSKGNVRIEIEGGSRVALGEIYHFEIKSEVSGRLIVADIDAAGKITQILPNKFTSGGSSRITAGKPLRVPGPDWEFTGFQAEEPLGKGTLLALVVPDDFQAPAASEEVAEQKSKGFAPVQSPTNYLMNLLQQVGGRASHSGLKGLAYDTLDYEIVRP